MNDVYSLVAWIVLLPFLGFLLQALTGKIVMDALGKRAGRVVMGTLAVLPVLGAFLIAVLITAQMVQSPAEGRTAVVTLFDWVTLQSISIPFELRVDPLSMVMTLVVTGVGALIHIYATGYMAEDRDFTRFFTYLNLFITMMQILVLGNNLPMLFIGWEGVGLCSYLLIGFWYKDIKNSKAANKAFIVNRIGDLGLLIGMFLLVVLISGARERLGIEDTRWLSFDVLLPHAQELLASHPTLAFWAAVCLFIGAMGKSAQFPLYVWLPDAMAGPTPVSALIHAATMVTSGVYLLNRMHPVFDAAPAAMALVTAVGVLTALIGALIAFGQTDIKKVLAYSTVSQLGFMFIACGVGAYWAGIFHVVTHAFFKALLFLGSGAVIYAMAHEQDMRLYGNLKKHIKVTFGVMFVGWAAIVGVPFLFAGFWSKEAVLAAAVNSYGAVGQVAGWVGFGVAMLTAAYMTRMMMLTFAGGKEQWRLAPAHAHHHDYEHSHAHGHHHSHSHEDDVHGFYYTDAEMARRAQLEDHEHHHALEASHKPKEVPVVMWAPLVVLAVLSTGVSGFWLNGVLKDWLYPDAVTVPKAIPLAVLIGVSIVVATLGILYGYLAYRKGLPASEGWDMAKWHPFRRAARAQFGFDDVATWVGLTGGGWFAKLCALLDDILIDGVVRVTAGVPALLSRAASAMQTGLLRAYALLMWLGIAGFIFYFLYMLQFAGGAP